MEEKKRKKIIIIVVTVIAALTVLCALGLFLAFVLFGVNSVNSSTHAHIVITPTPTMMPTPVITTPAPTEVPDKTETGDKITVTLKELEEDYFVVTWNKLSDEEVLGYNVYWADKDTETMKYELVASLGADVSEYRMNKATHRNYYIKVAPVYKDIVGELSAPLRTDTKKQFDVQLETLDRGLVLADTDYGVFLSWRLLKDEVTGYSETGLTGVNFNVYRNGENIATVENSTNYLASGSYITDIFYIEAIDEDGNILSVTEDAVLCTEDNYYDIPLQKPADGYISEDIAMEASTYTYSANDVSVGDVDGDGVYEYFVKWDPSNSKDVSVTGFTGNAYIDCYKLDGTLLYRIDVGINIRSGAHNTQFSVMDFNNDGKAEIVFKTAPGTKVIKYIDGDQTKGILSETYITLPAEDVAAGVTHQDDYRYTVDQFYNHVVEMFMDWGVWAYNSESGKAAKAGWDKNLENLWGVDASKQIVGHEGPYTRAEAEKLADYFIDVYAPSRSVRNDLRHLEGLIMTGPEYLTAFAGDTGEELDTVYFNIGREDDGLLWGDYAMARIEPCNRVERFLSGVAYLDGENPYIIMARGYYTRSTVTAYKLNEQNKLEIYWCIDSGWTVMTNPFNDGPHGMDGNDPVNGRFTGQGNHQLMAADVDNDGYQEIVYGGAIVDHDGTLYSSGTGNLGGKQVKYGHGDSMHVADIDPNNPGLEIFSCFEAGMAAPYGTALRDAETNVAIFGDFTGRDTGRCMIGDLDSARPGMETWGAVTRSAEGKPLSINTIGTNANIFWAGDMTTQILTSSEDSVTLTGLNNKKNKIYLDADGVTTNNSTKGNASLIADVLGDWREELLVRTTDSSALRIFISTELSGHKIYTLMHDAQYRAQVACQQTAYNQPAYPSFYLASDMEFSQIPLAY